MPVAITDDPKSISEPVFEIDANSRAIKIPDAFKHICVEGDQGAETVYFMIDRYFDTKDLAEDTEIIIQWETASAGKGSTPEKGATKAVLVDKDSYPTKLIFGWILDDRITKTAGNIKFSVRIYSIGVVHDDITDTDKRIVTYSFSTATATANIQPALNYNLLDDVVPEDNTKLMLNRLINSEASTPATAVVPVFEVNLHEFVDSEMASPVAVYVKDEDGNDTDVIDYYTYDLPDQTDLTATFTVLATANDAANLIYSWKHTNLDGDVKHLNGISLSYRQTTDETFKENKQYYHQVTREIEDDGATITYNVIFDESIIGTAIAEYGQTVYEKSGNLLVVTTDEVFVEGKHYYVCAAEGPLPVAYALIQDAEVGDSIADYNGGEAVYEKVGNLTINYDVNGAITGKYQVEVANRLGATNHAETDSTVLFIPGPAQPVIEMPEDRHVILSHTDASIDEATGVQISTDNGVTVLAADNIDIDDVGIVEYTWYDETETIVGNAETLSLDVAIEDLPKYDKSYTLEVSMTRNGDNKTTHCTDAIRVTDYPHAFVIEDNTRNALNEKKTWASTSNEKLEIILTNYEDILHDAVSYQWFKFEAGYDPETDTFVDSDGVVERPDMDELDIAIEGETQATLSVKNREAGQYYCRVRNTVKNINVDTYSEVYYIV